MYEVYSATLYTPRGRSVTMALRKDSSDWNTLFSCMDEDEYRLRELNLTGTALDVGAHIGGVSISLALDNPELRVIAIEAVPPNVDLLRENIERNGLGDRITVLHAAAGKGKTATIRWGFEGNESADHHAFIGNSGLPGLTNHLTEQVPVVKLADLIAEHGPIAFMKIDAEGAEYPFLQGPGLAGVELIRGEYHAEAAPLRKQLDPYFDVTFGDTIPGPFEAVLRA